MTQSQTTSLAALRGSMPPAAAFDAAPAPISVSMNTVQGFEALQRIAKLFAASNIVPPQYKNVPDAVIAVDMAMRMGANPLMVMQNLYLVHNRPAWSAQFLIATMNQCGRFSSIRYEFQGEEGEDSWGCRAVAIELSTGEKLIGPLVTIGLSKKEGWYNKKDKDGNTASRWPTMPELMLRYRAASWFVRTYAPEIAMGLQTVEEVKDTFDMERGTNGSYEMASADVLLKTDAEEPAAPEPEKADVPPVEPYPKPKPNGKGKPSSTAPARPDPAPKPEEDSGADFLPAPSSPLHPIFCPDRDREIEEDNCDACPTRKDCPSWRWRY